jgi:4a-hydroxytetrahydrobiopterin dehydratase
MEDLASKKCQACSVGAPVMNDKQISDMKSMVPEWNVVEAKDIKQLMRIFKFKDFKQTIAFVNKIADIAEENGHHPLMMVNYNKLTVWWWTHKINGLHLNDFIMAAKTDKI